MTNRYDRFIQPSEGIELVRRSPGSRVPRAPTLTRNEFAHIVRKIRPIFDEVAGRFDEDKYPPQVNKQALAAFGRPQQVSPEVLRSALLWKYGHLRKKGKIPPVHQKLIAEFQSAWPRVVGSLPAVPEQAFMEVDSLCGGRTRFITVAFLIHLLFPKQVPIIDQHNFRAVNALFHDLRPMWLGRSQPSKWSDVVLVGTFVEAVLSAWRDQAPASVPTRHKLDQFLMMYGKALKNAA